MSSVKAWNEEPTSPEPIPNPAPALVEFVATCVQVGPVGSRTHRSSTVTPVPVVQLPVPTAGMTVPPVVVVQSAVSPASIRYWLVEVVEVNPAYARADGLVPGFATVKSEPFQK